MKYARITNIRSTVAIALVVALVLCLASCTPQTPEPESPSDVQLTTKFAREGENEFSPQINGVVGEKFHCQIRYTNMSTEPQENLVIWAEMSNHFQALEDSGWYYDAKHLDGMRVRIEDDLVDGIKIDQCAGYDPATGATQGETIIIQFTIRVISAPAAGENLVAPVVGKIKTPSGEYDSSASIIIALPDT